MYNPHKLVIFVIGWKQSVTQNGLDYSFNVSVRMYLLYGEQRRVVISFIRKDLARALINTYMYINKVCYNVMHFYFRVVDTSI